MRLFLAIDLPERAKDDIISVQKQLKTFVKAKYVEKENLHITLKFLGDVENMKSLDPLNDVRFQPFKASLSNIGAFPNPNYIKVIWVGIKQGSDRIIQLHDEIESKIPFEKDKDYHPHVTLARVKSRVDERAKKTINSIFLNDEFEISKFVLYKSTLTPAGPVYEQVASFPK